MPVTGTIAGGFIKIALAGLESAKSQLAGIAAQSKKLGDALAGIGAVSARGFAVASGGVLGFLKAADPVRFEIFSQKLQILAMYIGRTFIPILDSAIAVVDRLIDYFKNLTDEQRESIVHWTKITLAVLAAGMALGVAVSIVTQLIGVFTNVTTVFGVLIGVIPKLVGGLRALSGAFNILGSVGPLKLILLLGTLAAVFYEVMQSGGVLQPILDTLGTVFETLREPVALLMTAFQDALKTILPPLIKIFETLATVFMTLAPVLIKLVEIFAKILAIFIEIAAVVLGVVAEALGALLEVLGDVLSAFWDAFGDTIIDAVNAVGDVVKGVVDFIRGLVDVLKDVADAVGDIIDSIGDGISDAVDFLNPFSSGSDEKGGKPGQFGTLFQAAVGEEQPAAPEDNTNVGSKNRKLNPTGAGVYGKGTGAGGSFDDGDDESGGKGKDPKFMPKAPVQRVEQFGLEEAFKKAQAGASFDPTKIAENERKKLLADSLNELKEINEKTSPKDIAALSSF